MKSQEVGDKIARKGQSQRCLLHFSSLLNVHIISRSIIINNHVTGRTQESLPRVEDLQHWLLGKPPRGMHFLETQMGFQSSSRNMVIDSFSDWGEVFAKWAIFSFFQWIWHFILHRLLWAIFQVNKWDYGAWPLAFPSTAHLFSPFRQVYPPKLK